MEANDVTFFCYLLQAAKVFFSLVGSGRVIMEDTHVQMLGQPVDAASYMAYSDNTQT